MLANTVQIAYLEYMEAAAAVYAGQGAEVGKWFSVKGKLTKFHLIAKRAPHPTFGWMMTNALCGSSFRPEFEFSPTWENLGGTKCPKCEAKA